MASIDPGDSSEGAGESSERERLLQRHRKEAKELRGEELHGEQGRHVKSHSFRVCLTHDPFSLMACISSMDFLPNF